MTQLYFPSESPEQQSKTYYYLNRSSKIVIVKLKGLNNRHCERTLFPQEQFLFTAPAHCQLEIYTQTPGGIIKDTLYCSELAQVVL